MSDSWTRSVRSGMALSLVVCMFGLLAQAAHAQSRGGDDAISRPPTAPPPPPPIQQGDFVCADGAEYQIVWGAGWRGRLVLSSPAPPYYLPLGFLESGGSLFPVFYHVLAEPQEYVDGEQGPGYRGTDSTLHHRIVFWVHFDTTSRNWQRFDGYLMTETRDAMAGVTRSRDVPYGFYATDKKCIDIEG